MIATLLTSLIKDLLRLLSRTRQFFSLRQSERQALLVRLPCSIQRYLLEVEENQFMRDLEGCLKNIRNGKFNHHLETNNGLLIALGHFLIEDAAPYLDNPAVFDSAEEIFVSLQSIVKSFSYEELANAIQIFLKDILNAPFILVQTAAPITPEFKGEIRTNFKKAYPLAFPIFQVNSSLLGGLKIFLNGEVYDHTWLNKIDRIYNLN